MPSSLLVQDMEGDLNSASGDLLWLELKSPSGSLQARFIGTIPQPSRLAKLPMKGVNLANIFPSRTLLSIMCLPLETSRL